MALARYDFLIIGGGQAGIPLAYALAQAGRKIALAERKFLGGSCVNFGCTPSKAVIASARVAALARRGAEFGLDIPAVKVNFRAVIERAVGIAQESRAGLESGFAQTSNPALLRGHARILGPGFRVQVGEHLVEAGELILNTGARAILPDIPGLSSVPYLTSGNWLHSTELPARLAMIGAGYIGLEMAQFYQRMGSKVTVWNHGPRVIEQEDEDVSAALQASLEAEGVKFRLNTEVRSLDDLDGDLPFIAVGRRPNTDDLGLETIGVELDGHGYVKVDRRLAASTPGVWAAGDIRGGPQFTHTAWDDNRILASQLLGDGSRTTDRIVPYAVFTDPELGRVGLTEAQARAQNLQFQVKRFDLKSNGKARELGETRGFIKVLLEAGSDRILGAAVLGTEASELVHMYVDVMNAGAPAAVIRDAIHIHPTLAEAVQSAIA